MTVGNAAPGAATPGGVRSGTMVWRRFRRHRLAVGGVAVLLALTLLTVLAPLIAPYDPAAIHAASAYAPSSPAHLLGTDALGRDTLSRLLYAGRVSLAVGLAVALLSAVIGVGLGLLAGFYNGRPLLLAVGPLSPRWAAARRGEGRRFWPRMALRWAVWAVIIAFMVRATGQFAATLSAGPAVTLTWGLGLGGAAVTAYLAFLRAIAVDADALISRLIDILLAVPSLPFLLILAGLLANPAVGIGPALDAALGPARSVGVIVAVLVAFGWLAMARIVRGTILSLRAADFNEAAVGLGASDARVMLRHLLPNAVAPIFVQVTLDLGHAIVAEAALSFLGLGIQEPTASWGNMLGGAQEAIFQQPTAVFWPGLCILLTTLSVNYIGDGLRDAMDPRSRL